MAGFERKSKRKKKKAASMCCDAPYDPERWEIERDMEALARAEAVRSDPERLKKCQKLAAEKMDENKRRRDEAQALINMGAAAEN